MPAPPTAKQPGAAEADQARTQYTDLGDGAVSGNLTRDPELRFTPDGRAVATMRVAETLRVFDQATQKWGDGPTSFYDVTAWGDLAGNVSDCLSKGDRIAAVGKWQKQDWTKDDGTPGSKVVLVCRDVGPSLLFKRAYIETADKGKGDQQ